MRRLVIDDLHIMSFEAIYARTVTEGLARIIEGPWDEVWWDFDLGFDVDGNKSTVKPVLHFVEEKAFHGQKLALGTQIIISDNGPGRDELELALSRLYPVKRNVFRNRYSVGTIDI